MSNCCCKYKLLEISRLLCHANMHTIELSRTFHQVTQLLHVCNTTKIVLCKLLECSEHFVNVYKDFLCSSSCCCCQE